MDRKWLPCYSRRLKSDQNRRLHVQARHVCLDSKVTKAMASYRPTKIYASLGSQPTVSPPKKLPKVKEDMKKSTTANPNEIQVSAIGELSVTPDRCRMQIAITSKKERAQEAKNSVSRRLDYILQTLHNHQVKVQERSARLSPRSHLTMFYFS